MRLILLCWLLLLMPGVAWPDVKCGGPFEGKRLDQRQMLAVWTAHLEWIKAKPKEMTMKVYMIEAGGDAKRANLCGANLSILPDLTKADPIDTTLAKIYLLDGLSGANLSEANLSGVDLTFVDMKDADLNSADLSNANLSNAELRGAKLIGANLRSANLSEASLQRANLFAAKLSEAELSKANLSEADLRLADLSGVNLKEADLSGADLTVANLHEADLKNTNLAEAKLERAEMSGALFAPKLGKLPDIYLAFARNLEQMRTEPESLVILSELREAFKKAGFRDAERAMTYLMKRQQEEEEPPLERRFNRIFFNWTCGYGLYPGRCLLLLFVLALPLSFVYFFALFRAQGGGLWAVWPSERTDQTDGADGPVRLSFAQPFPPLPPSPTPPPDPLAAFRPGVKASKPQPPGRFVRALRGLARLFQALWVALYFSLLSAFHFGWRDLNVGNWIARIQHREYAIRPTGWVRVVSGIQSLISVYLVALWALSYFGRPFE